MSALEKFFRRHNEALKSKSKEFRMDMDFASELANEISILQNKQNELNDKVISLQSKIIELTQNQQKENKEQIQSEISIDAGTFKQE